MRGGLWLWLALAGLRTMLGVWLLGLLAMSCLAGAFLLIRRPELELLSPARLATGILLELGPESLLLCLPLGIGHLTQRFREGGELRALGSLPRPLLHARLAMLAPLPLFLLLQGLWLHRVAPLDRLELRSGHALEASPSPELLARLLPDWSASLGGFAVSHGGVDERGLGRVSLVHFEAAQRVLVVHAEGLELGSLEDSTALRLRLRNGRAWRGDPRALGASLDFDELRILVSPGRSPEEIDPGALPSRILLEDGERLLARQILIEGADKPQRGWKVEVMERRLAQLALLISCLLASCLHPWRDPARAGRLALAYALPSLLGLLLAPGLVRLLP